MGADSSDHYERIRLIVRRSRGVDLAHYRPSYIDRRVKARMRARGAADPSSYARILAKDSDEIVHLLGALSTSVTSFFRDPGLFRTLDGRIIPDLLAGPPGRTIRLWSAGCATGEETWSLASLAAGHAKPVSGGRIKILGTDVDRPALVRARKGEYPLASLKKLPVEVQRRWFTAHPLEGVCRVAPSLKAITSFRVESLDRRPAAGAFDLILCRNVLIYFDPVLQERIHQQFARALRPGGYLALGRVERIVGPAREAFQVVNARERIHRRL